MCKEDLALNNLQWLICHTNPTKPNHIYLIYKKDLALNNLQWLIRTPRVAQWFASLTSKPARVSSSLIGCPIQSEPHRSKELRKLQPTMVDMP